MRWSSATSIRSMPRSLRVPARSSSASTCVAAISGGATSRTADTNGLRSVFFTRAEANHFLLEYDTPRAGDFAPLRFVPKGKGVVLGLISSKTPVLETIDSLQRRVDEATKYIAPERLAISPQCGFASSVGGNPLTERDERTKLRLAVDAAHAIWR